MSGQEHRAHSAPTALRGTKGGKWQRCSRQPIIGNGGVGMISQLGTAWNAAWLKKPSCPILFLLLCSSYFLSPTPSPPGTSQPPNRFLDTQGSLILQDTGNQIPKGPKGPELRDYPGEQTTEPEVAPMLLKWSGAQLNLF